MASRFLAVLGTYATRRELWVSAGLLALVFLLMAIARMATPESVADNMAIVWTNVLLGFSLSRHVQSQFSNPRARLTPCFAGPHFMVPGSIIALAVAIECGFFARSGGASVPAVAGLALALVAASAWCSYWDSVPLGLIITVLMVGGSFGYHVIAEPVKSHLLCGNPAVVWGVFGLGIAGLAALGVRFSRLSEESSAYRRPAMDSPPESADDVASPEGKRYWRQRERQEGSHSWLQGLLYDLQFRLLLRVAKACRPLRPLVLRHLGSGTPFSFHALLIWGALAFMLIRGAIQESPSDPYVLSPFLLSTLPACAMLLVLGNGWLWRWPYLSREFLHPMGRSDFARSLLRVATCQTAAVGVGHCLLILVALAFLSSESWPSSFILRCLAATVVHYSLMFPVTFWLVSFHNSSLLFLMTLIVMLAAMGIASVVRAGIVWSPASVTVAIVATTASTAWLYRLTFRWWRYVELN